MNTYYVAFMDCGLGWLEQGTVVALRAAGWYPYKLKGFVKRVLASTDQEAHDHAQRDIQRLLGSAFAASENGKPRYRLYILSPQETNDLLREDTITLLRPSPPKVHRLERSNEPLHGKVQDALDIILAYADDLSFLVNNDSLNVRLVLSLGTGKNNAGFAEVVEVFVEKLCRLTSELRALEIE